MKAVLFDLDGTLLDTRRIYAESFGRAFASELDEVPSFEEIARLGPSSERTFLVEHWGVELGGRIHARMLEHYEARAASLLGGLYEGVWELLEELRARRVRLGIVTGKSRAAFEITRAHVDLGPFEVVVVEDDVPAAKPDPAGIRVAMERLDVRDAVYVGDTHADAVAAQRAGAQPAAALWGRTDAERARVLERLDAGAWALGAPAELLTHLERRSV